MFWLCCAFYIATASGHTYSPDEETMVAVSDAIVHTHSVKLRHADGQPWAALRDGADYGRYAAYGILPSLLALPASTLSAAVFVRGSTANTDLTRLLASLINAPITAATITCLAVLLERTSLPRGARVWTLVAAAVGSCLWPYARTFFSEPLTALLITASLTAATSPVRSRRTLLLAGLCAGLLLPTRVAAGIAIPILAAAALWQPPRRWRDVFTWGAALVPGVALWCAYNQIRFGTPFASGYSTESAAFGTSLTVGLPGLLVSPGTGLLWYAPFVVFIPFGIRSWWRSRPTILLSALTLLASNLLLYGMWDAWDGGGVWGPRFLVPCIPAAILIAAGVWSTPQPWLQQAARLVIGAGVVINVLGVAVNFSIDSNLHATTAPPITHAKILWQRVQTLFLPENTCRIERDWYPSEAADHILWQRSAGASTFRCNQPSGAVLQLSFDDRRPAGVAPSGFVLDTGSDRFAVPNGAYRRVFLLSKPGPQRYTVRSTPWNPASLGFGDRADDLGPTLLAMRATPPLLAIADASVAPMPTQPLRRWAWYYEPTNRHLADWWAVYLPATALAPWSGLFWLGWACAVGTALCAAWFTWRPRA